MGVLGRIGVVLSLALGGSTSKAAREGVRPEKASGRKVASPSCQNGFSTRTPGWVTAHWTAAPAPLRSPGLGFGPYPAPSLGQRTLLASITDRPQHRPNDHISATKTSARGKTRGCQEGPCTHPLASGGAGWPSAALPGPEPGAGPPDGVPTVAEGCT